MGDRVVAIIQARTGSTRLPGKVLLPLGGRTVLERMLERVMRARLLDDVIVATTILPADNAIVDLASAMGVSCYRGHPTDLLDRHVHAAAAARASHIVKIPSDCPLIDPKIVDAVVLAYLGVAGAVSYASNLHPATYPDGNDVEIMSRTALEHAWHEARVPSEREHTTPFIWTQPDRFRMINVRWDTGRNAASTHRYVLDYQDDYLAIAAIFDALYSRDPEFGVEAITTFLDTHPEIAAVNSRRRGMQSREVPFDIRQPLTGSAA